ncbi:MAG: potassium channel family protein [Candidatus Sumerlaeia bacterium]
MNFLAWLSRQKWITSILVLVFVVVVGVFGYMTFAPLNWLDALYQTVITLTATGYHDYAALMGNRNPPLIAFTIFYNVFGIVTVASVFGLLLRSLIEGRLRETIGIRRTKRKVRFMKNHYIVCGCGRMGEIIAETLQRDHIPVIVVDTDYEKKQMLAEKNITAITGDATHDAVLKEAAIDKAKGLIAVTNADPENLFITMSARQLNPNLIIVSRALTIEAEQKLLRAGASRVILPYKLGAHQLAQAALRPNVVDFIEIATRTSQLDIEIEELMVQEGSEMVGKKLREATILRELGIIIIGIRSHGNGMQFNPRADTPIQAGDTLIALGKDEKLKEAKKHLA